MRQITFMRKRYEHIEGTENQDPANVPELVDVHDDAARQKIGVWRWTGIQQFRDMILPVVQSRRTMDFGGSAGPIGYGAEIVDYEAPARAPYDICGDFGCIFTSHTLEHVPDIELCVGVLCAKLAVGGRFIAFVPHWTNEKLRAENWPPHCQTFYMTDDKCPYEDGWPEHWVDLQMICERYVDIAVAEVTDDENMIIIGDRTR